jgi:hypothetical protein
MQTKYVGAQPVEFGDFKPCILLGVAGPTSYAQATGDPVANPAAGDYIAAPTRAISASKNYAVDFFPNAVDDIRAGALSGMQSGWTALWSYSGNLGVSSVVQNVAGSGMTVGTVVPIVFSGGNGTGAAGTVTVLTATTVLIQLTNSGAGYTSTPTVTVSGTGGTPPTLTAAVFPGYGPVANTTNLSTEQVQFAALITER